MLTFEQIRDMERLERGSPIITKIPERFIDEVRDYLRRKEAINDKKYADMLELDTIKNTITRLCDLRVKKIAEQALVTTKTGAQPENLTKEEERLFYRLVDGLKEFRERFFELLEKEFEQQEQSEKYRVVKRLPPFIGPDMKVYTLNENDIVETMPKPLNELLLREGVIEVVR